MSTQKSKDGAWLFAQECHFIAGAVKIEDIPPLRLPEIAFIGRSNVGKSSLVNALTGRKTLAKTSQTPGRTKQLNFFSLGERLLLVDLPGYGYAKAAKKDIAGWTRLMKDYLRGRPNLKRACLLMDARLGPQAADDLMMELLDESAVSYQAILTKIDKASQEALTITHEKVKKLMTSHAALHPEIIATSARMGTGIADLREELARFTF